MTVSHDIKDDRVAAEGESVSFPRRATTLLAAALVAAVLPGAPAQGAALPPGPRLDAPARNKKTVKFPNLRWAPVPRATQYEIEVAQDSRFENITTTITTSANQFIDTEQWPSASYWWRVRVRQPFRTQWSEERTLTQRWLVPDVHTGKLEVARPDNVTVEDVSPEPGIQAAENLINISWEPVANASYYVVDFDSPTPANRARCLTPHTALTPYITESTAPKPGPGSPGLALLEASAPCSLTKGHYSVRVRAIDRIVTGYEYPSLWSDEARSQKASIPRTVSFTVGEPLTGSADSGPANLTAPENGTRFTDSPVLEWDPVAGAAAYEVVIALDQDFTTVAGTFTTRNTRIMPTGRFPEDNARRAYYWHVLPCVEIASPTPTPSGPTPTPTSTQQTPTAGKTYSCVPSNQAVNRQGKFRHFIKLSPTNIPGPMKRRGPWTRVQWTAFANRAMEVNKRLGQPAASIGGIDHYEVQVRRKGTMWTEAQSINTDFPVYMQNETTDVVRGLPLQFGTRYQWRVRVVDGSGQPRPWGRKSDWITPSAQAWAPRNLMARRDGNKVRLTWREPRRRFFSPEAYQVFYSSNGRRWKPLNTVSGTSATYRVPRKRYWFSVNAVNRGGEGRPARVRAPG